MGTLYANRVSSGDIGTAIAESVIEDVRINGLGIQGFPQNTVARPSKDSFVITLKYGAHTSEFATISNEAKRAVKLMKAKKGHDAGIFRRVQDAAIEIESLEGRSFDAAIRAGVKSSGPH